MMPIMTSYVYRPNGAPTSFSESVRDLERMGHHVMRAAVDGASPGIVQAILEMAREEGIDFSSFEIDPEAFYRYVADAQYITRYEDYYRDNRLEKMLEHYVALKLLKVNNSDVFLDIASESSPVAEIYSRLTGSTCFSQDIMYPDGIHDHRIGGDACFMPVPDGFAMKASLTCSLEHFEEDSDSRLFRELARVIKPGGAVCVVPLYLFVEAVTQTDPAVSVPSKVLFDQGNTIYCAEGWGNRHGRFYSPQSFVKRVLNPAKDSFRFDLYHLKNTTEIDQSIYARFACLATRL
jgi:SAM-dependent methyltransferase